MSRAVVAFPGQGSYTGAALGSLPADHDWVRRADEMRRARGLAPLSELDRARAFDPAIHLRAANAAPLTFLCGLLDAERIVDDHEVVVVVASSTGWATALAASGALGFDDAFRLVQELALLADEHAPATAGGQVIYPLADGDWLPDPDRIAAVAAALAEGDGDAYRSVELGGFTIIGANASGVGRLLEALPSVTASGRTFPMRLAHQGPWHTPLSVAAAERASEELADLEWQAPNVTLIDGTGRRFTPWSTDPVELARATLTDHVVSTYDFALSLRVALREYAPDVVLLPGPGSSLGAPAAHVIIAEGYHGLRSRADLEAAQAADSPILLSMRR
ncbi:MAG: hypothetical protein ACRDLA_14410 [Thermoleophilaceae bacterium]